MNGCSESRDINSTNETLVKMAELYDYYYTVQEYSRRYPKPNQATLGFLLKNGAETADTILDYGCGNGRYAVPLLQQTKAHLTGYDISQPAITEFTHFLQGTPLEQRVSLYCGKAALLEKMGGYDLIMMMFGVLSHVGVKAERLNTLRHLRCLISCHGRLILTVPSTFRRRPAELLRAAVRRACGKAPDVLQESRNIEFTRKIADKELHFFYHLYTVKELCDELKEAGFVANTVCPESILPEWMITQSSLLGKIDAALLPLLPASLGYGICVAADPV